MSIRSSHRRRREALRHLDRTFLQCCEDRSAGMTGKGLEHLSLAAFVRLNSDWLDAAGNDRLLTIFAVHTSLLTLLTRHAQTLCKRGTSLPPGDEAATSLSPELVSIIGILQGLCLVSHACKEAVGEIWIMEVRALHLYDENGADLLIAPHRSSFDPTCPAAPVATVCGRGTVNSEIDCLHDPRPFVLHPRRLATACQSA